VEQTLAREREYVIRFLNEASFQCVFHLALNASLHCVKQDMRVFLLRVRGDNQIRIEAMTSFEPATPSQGDRPEITRTKRDFGRTYPAIHMSKQFGVDVHWELCL
jgi:hypothetical protein